MRFDIIKGVEPYDCRLVLEHRYLNFKSWEEISNVMKYSYRQVHRIHSDALKHIEMPREIKKISLRRDIADGTVT